MNDCLFCPVANDCFYPYKPCDCVHQRKFWSKERRTESLRTELISYLLPKTIPDVNFLWAEAKSWAEMKHYIMGGTYASFSSSIIVRLKIDDEQFRFEIDLKDLKK